VHSSTWLCVKCCYDLGIDPFAKIKKVPKKKAPVKEDRAKVVHYEARKGVAPLGDICIHVSWIRSTDTDDSSSANS
jgi:DNA repair protein RAD7